MNKKNRFRPILTLVFGIIGWILVFNMKNLDLKYHQQDDRDLYDQMGSPIPSGVGGMLDLMDTFKEEFYLYRGPVWVYNGYLLLNHQSGNMYEFLATQGIAMRVFATNINACTGLYQDIHFVLYHQVDVENNQWVIAQDLAVGDLNFDSKSGAAIINVDARPIEFTYTRDNTPNDCDQSRLRIKVVK